MPNYTLSLFRGKNRIQFSSVPNHSQIEMTAEMRLRSGSGNAARYVVAVVGGIIMDLVFEVLHMPRLDESIRASSLAYEPGGKGSNTSIALYRAQHNKPPEKPGDKLIEKPNSHSIATGTKVPANDLGKNKRSERIEVAVYLNTAVGDDEFGRKLKENLQNQGVDISGIRTLSNGTTGTCAVIVEKYTGESRNIAYPGTNINWVPDSRDSVECLTAGKTPDLLICNLAPKTATIRHLLKSASERKVDTLLNPSLMDYLLTTTYPYVTHLVLSEKEAAQLSAVSAKELETLKGWQKSAKYFLDAGVENVVIILSTSLENKYSHIFILSNYNAHKFKDNLLVISAALIFHLWKEVCVEQVISFLNIFWH